MLSQPPQPSGSQPLGHRDKQVNILCQSLVWKMPGLACLLGECYAGPVRSDLDQSIRIQSPYLIPPLSIFHDIETSPHTSLPSHAMINVLSGMRPIIRIITIFPNCCTRTSLINSGNILLTRMTCHITGSGIRDY